MKPIATTTPVVSACSTGGIRKTRKKLICPSVEKVKDMLGDIVAGCFAEYLESNSRATAQQKVEEYIKLNADWLYQVPMSHSRYLWQVSCI
jgi:hypothetical protein